MTAFRAVRRVRLPNRDGILTSCDVPCIGGVFIGAVFVDIGDARDWESSVPSRIAYMAYGSAMLQLEGEHGPTVEHLSEWVQRALAEQERAGVA